MGQKLGQHFLKSPAVAKAIRDAADPTGDDIILEIGPGKGALTEQLLTFAGKIIAVEKDQELVAFLKEKYATAIEGGKLEVLFRDILQFDPHVLSFYQGHSYKIIANIPYYITGAIIRKFLTAEYQPTLMVLLIQKEVAERIVARPDRNGKVSESVLSISVKAYGIPTIVQHVPARLFSPAPKVDSSVLKIDTISTDFFTHNNIDPEKFFTLVKAGFAHKRKKLVNNLGLLTAKEHVTAALTASNLIQARAENLSLSDWQNVYKKIFSADNNVL
jgi:16S rRNA (adenine1518-N6/adenine1519-N6)-dimethyltransferase